jgi:hypothetical protein
MAIDSTALAASGGVDYGAIAGAVAAITDTVADAFDSRDNQQGIAEASSAARIAEAQARSSEAMALQASAAASTSLTSVISQNPMTVAALVLGALLALVYAVRR